MARIWMVILVVLVFGFFGTLAHTKGGVEGKNAAKVEGCCGKMAGKGECPMTRQKGEHGKMGMMQKMMGSMMQRSMVASNDGGVFVLNGTKLVKFDKNLKVVKEVELKHDMEGMHRTMSRMMEGCPMMRHIMDKDKDQNHDAVQTEHSQHH